MKDVDDICRHINDRLVARYMSNVPHPYKRTDGEFFIRKMVKKGIKAKTDYPLSIYEKQKKEVIGGVGLHKVDLKNRHAEVGYWLGRKYWRQGYVSEALGMILDFGFRKLKLKRIWAGVYHPNIPSQRLLMKAGFTKEGVLRKHTRKGSKEYDNIMFGMLREEYERKK
jgi:RimJ/RimL family protein N-acetyltransferase